ncbi:hypothetical protein Q7C36_011168 [Tachysurus vachellii]|uniref:Uncharacterized protein n=1 Tax=Tachysurus vachellii TaxID=175792 RepID=A0AA88MT19_TACVA|nr:hypothetical protein Q7C36_011168 [Tachysurus vachellii]
MSGAVHCGIVLCAYGGCHCVYSRITENLNKNVPDSGPAAEGNSRPPMDREMAQATSRHLADEAEHGGATGA